MNPLKNLKEQASALKTQIEAVNVTSRNQTELLRQNVELQAKQSVIFKGWRNAAVTQAEILQEISNTLKEISETLKVKKTE